MEGECWRPEGYEKMRETPSADNSKTKSALADSASPLDQTTRSKLKLGLFSYPVLQAADILLYG